MLSAFITQVWLAQKTLLRSAATCCWCLFSMLPFLSGMDILVLFLSQTSQWVCSLSAFRMLHQKIAHITSMNQIWEIHCQCTNSHHTNNNFTQATLYADYFSRENYALPQINNALDDIGIHTTHCMQGEDVTHFRNHSGENQAEAREQEMGQKNIIALV